MESPGGSVLFGTSAVRRLPPGAGSCRRGPRRTLGALREPFPTPGRPTGNTQQDTAVGSSRGGDESEACVATLMWWLIPIGATVLAVLFVMLRGRPTKPTAARDSMQNLKAMQKAMERPLPPDRRSSGGSPAGDGS